MVELLAHHFGRSAEDNKAVEYAMRAAEKAQCCYAPSATLGYLVSTVARLEAMPDTLSNRLRKIDAVLKQGEARFALGQHTEHIASLEGIRVLVDEAADPCHRATWAYWMGFLHILTGSRPDIAIAYCREASALAEAGGVDVIRASADACLAQVYVFTGDLWEAVIAGERALTIFEEHGHIWWAFRTLWHLSTAANALGGWERGLAYCRRALEYGEAVGDPRLKAVGWWRTGSTYIQLGDPEKGLQCCAEALALAPSPYDTAFIQAVRGYGLVKVGQIDTGTAELTAAVAWLAQSYLGYPHAVFALFLGEAYLRQGERGKVRTLCEGVLVASQQAGYYHLAGVAKRLLGEALVLEEPEAAAGHLAEAVHSLWELGARNEVAKAWVAQATLRQATGDAAGAQQLLTQALDLFATLGTRDEPGRVQALLATL